MAMSERLLHARENPSGATRMIGPVAKLAMTANTKPSTDRLISTMAKFRMVFSFSFTFIISLHTFLGRMHKGSSDEKSTGGVKKKAGSDERKVIHNGRRAGGQMSKEIPYGNKFLQVDCLYQSKCFYNFFNPRRYISLLLLRTASGRMRRKLSKYSNTWP